MAAKDMSIDTQLGEMFREEASQARLPQRTWLELSSRMGEPETPNVLWRLRHALALPRWQGSGIARFAWPAAAVVFAALAVALFVLFSNNNTDKPHNPAPATSPTVPPAESTTAPRPEISRQQAAAIAEEQFAKGDEQATAVENPHNMVLRLMRVKDVRNAESLPFFASHANTLVWIAQVEGISQPVEGEPRTYRFNVAMIDAVTGEVIGRSMSEYEPFILPLELLPEELVEINEDMVTDRNSLPVTRDDAVRMLTALLDSLFYNSDDIETALVRYSNPSMPGDGSLGPGPTPTAAGPTPTPPTNPGPTRVPQPTETPVVTRLSWLVMMPAELGSDSCVGRGGPSVLGPRSGPAPTGLNFGEMPVQKEAYPLCWTSVFYYFVDAETGNVYYSKMGMKPGPEVTDEEFAALQRFAWAEGWWALWHEVKQYNGQRLPEGLAAELDRPDAPTPTPFPPTATPPANATATATPTPPPTPTPAASPTAAPMQINRVNFGSPVSGTVFEKLLARMPDNQVTRRYVQMADVAGTLQLLGIERPEPGADEAARQAFVEKLVTTQLNGLGPAFPGWPTELRRYMGGENPLNPYPYTGIDLMLSVDQFISAGSFFVPTEDPQALYDIALGQFDPDVTAAALAACECDQPDIREYEGADFYSWGEEGIGDIDRRFAPPFYDHVGRGPRLLVRDGEAYYTAWDRVMEDYIDTLTGAMPSLADDEGYIGAVRWLATLGTMRDITVQADGLSAAEMSDLYTGSPEIQSSIEESPLLAPFDLAATGIGFDGERVFTGLVIANPDADTAVTNAALLEERIRNGQLSPGMPWSDGLGLVEIAVDGRFVIARLYSRDPLRQGMIDFTFFNTLIVHE